MCYLFTNDPVLTIANDKCYKIIIDYNTYKRRNIFDARKKIKEIKRDVRTFIFILIKFIINFLLLISSFICSVKLYYIILSVYF